MSTPIVRKKKLRIRVSQIRDGHAWYVSAPSTAKSESRNVWIPTSRVNRYGGFRGLLDFYSRSNFDSLSRQLTNVLSNCPRV
jgi:hypothetical protein